ncbi:MAG: PAC2 family protein [Ilumatobacteraceae bacterium]|nr:PAC2 family protein [Ilumatobacteraceae bacterium]
MAIPASVHWLSKPALRNPTFVSAFTGWNDAADAASSAVRHLIDGWGATPLAEISPEPYTDFATIRPHVRLGESGERKIMWPTVTLWHVSGAGGDVILSLGPEPSLQWKRFAGDLLSVAEHFGSTLFLTLGALLADVAHRRPVQLIGTATDADLIERFSLRRSRYEGPTGIIGVLHDEFSRAALPSASLWAAVPAYASQVPSPKASLALMRRTCEIIGTPAPIGAVLHLIERYEEQVNTLVNEDDDLVEYVERLETATDSGMILSDEVNDDQLQLEFVSEASDEEAAEFVDEVERFLREQNSD